MAPSPPNWSTPHQIATHQLATSIINTHSHSSGDNAVFDAPSLATLKRFCLSPTAATRSQIMREENWEEPADCPEGAGTAAKGSLVGYVVVKHGSEDPVFDERDLELLGRWFGKGMRDGEKVVR